MPVINETFTDSLVLSDSARGVLSLSIKVSDSMVPADGVSIGYGYSDNLSNWADSYSSRLLVTQTEVQSDNINNLADSFTTHVDPAFYFSGQLNLLDSIAITFPQPAASVASLSFQVPSPGLTPDPQTVSISNALLGPLTFSITTDVPWLQVTPVSATAPQDIQVSVNTFGLGGGTYTGNIFVFGSGPAIVPVTLVIGPGDVTVLAGGNTIGVITASGAGETSFLDVLYRYANLTLPYNPQDPGLQYTYDNSSLAEHVLLNARFFNLLNEPSLPLVVDVGTAALAGASGGTIIISGNQLFECLDVRLFGAVGDGKTDDTAAVQRALDQASKNYQAKVAAGLGVVNNTLTLTGSTLTPGITGAPGPLGSTVVCIPSGVYCLVYPRIPDSSQSCRSFLGGPFGGDSGFGSPGFAALLIDDGVTILCDGGLILGLDVATLRLIDGTGGFSAGLLIDGGVGLWILQNRQAFTGGPSIQPGGGPADYQFSLETYEAGPRNANIRITGKGFFDAGARAMALEPLSAVFLYALSLGAICFCKCDQSQIDGLTFQHFTASCGVYWGHSEKINIFENTFQHMYSAGFATDGGSGAELTATGTGIIADVLRASAIYANRAIDIDAFVWEYACYHTDIHDNIANQCGIPCAGTHFFADISFMFCWTFSTNFNSDGNRYANHYANNRGIAWQSTTLLRFAEASLMTQTSYLIGNHVYTWFPCSPVNEPSPFQQNPFGITGPTEPNWNAPTGLITFVGTFFNQPFFAESVISISGGFVSFVEESNIFLNKFAWPLPFTDINPTGTSIVVYVNGVVVPPGAGTWEPGQVPLSGPPVLLNQFITFNPSYGLHLGDLITYDVQTQVAWVDRGLAYIQYPNCAACMQFIGTALGTNDTPANGVRVIANQVSDNYMDGIGFEGMENLQISHSLVQRNYGAGIVDLTEEGGIGASQNVEVIDNFSANNFGPNILVPAGDGTINNPAIDAATITRGGVTQVFGNVVKGEVPAGAINGVNTVFTLAHTPLAGTIKVYEDGLRTGAYTLTGATITFTTAPTTSVAADYEW